MGKKRIIEKSQEELLKEREKLDKELKRTAKTRAHKAIEEGRVYIYCTYNNTIISITDLKGNVLAWTSAGALGFKGTRKSTPFAASKVAEMALKKLGKLGVGKVEVFIRGIGSGRSSALRSLANRDLNITAIEDVTPIPHNGCRPPKKRRT